MGLQKELESKNLIGPNINIKQKDNNIVRQSANTNRQVLQKQTDLKAENERILRNKAIKDPNSVIKSVTLDQEYENKQLKSMGDNLPALIKATTLLKEATLKLDQTMDTTNTKVLSLWEKYKEISKNAEDKRQKEIKTLMDNGNSEYTANNNINMKMSR